MDYYVIIPAHNEETFIGLTLDSIVKQTLLPKKVIVVNDNSTDGTEKIIDEFASTHPFITKLNTASSTLHMPGSKVINAFKKGTELTDDNYAFIVKLDADIILPHNYFEKIAYIFKERPQIGISGGFIYEQDNEDKWVLNHPMDKNHIRGAIKAYSKSCYKAIGGLKSAMGWDTVDELLAQYHGFELYTDDTLRVKHLRPTGNAYDPKAKLLQGKAMYTMRYGFWITLIASLKMAIKNKKLQALSDNMYGYFEAEKEKTPFLVTEKEGRFIRKLRWRNIKQKIMA
ncbi:glycosyltransferase family 2 protein [Maribacter sp. MMG018]|uniref:glycosyltransferase family 2 protein n=1 Tax=Maribacter sp. MMG018 TaxID=2822688 RepID=UPI001B398DAD|nr:glycosyltransferase family A protein [Maribacter sp. MMG018]MBQ4914069.1 glycosyltransferase family 2 protein [Maribacter sp. MMG018]